MVRTSSKKVESKNDDSDQGSSREMVTVCIMGKAYKVPADATIMGAIEYAGYQVKRGAGCREGFCGACPTVFRMPNDYKLYTCLACTTVVEDGMFLAQLPMIPADKPTYDIDTLVPDVTTFQKIFPEVFKCIACNTCTKACPQDLQVMDYIQAVIRGDIEEAMDLSFDCLSCGLCAIRCPAEIVHFNVGILAKRLYGKYLVEKSPELEARLKEINEGIYDAEYQELMSANHDTLKKQYYDRDIEAQ